MKTKVLFLLGHLQYSDGVAKALCDLCNNLPKDQYDITVTSLYRYDRRFLVNFSDHVKTNSIFGFYFHGLDKIVSLIPKSLLYKIIVREEYDIEVGFQYGLSTEIVAASSNKRAVHVAWMHGYDDGLKLIKCYQKMDYVICVSKCNAERLKAEANGTVRSNYCYNLVDDNKLRVQACETIDKELCNFHPILVSVGRQSPEKGYKRLIIILSQLIDEGSFFECWLIGDGPEHSMLCEMVRDLNKTKYIKLLGSQNNPHRYTAKADLFICSSFSEGYSTACTEAAALGIPIITTNVSGGEEIIEAAECGSVVSTDDESLKNELRRVLNSPSILSVWKKTAEETAHKFSLHERREKTIKLFQEIASKSNCNNSSM